MSLVREMQIDLLLVVKFNMIFKILFLLQMNRRESG